MATAVAESLDSAITRLFASDPPAMADSASLWRRLHNEAPVYRFGASILFSRYEDVREIRMHGLEWGHHGVPRDTEEADAIVARLPEDDRPVLATLMEFEDLFLSRTGDRVRHDRLRQIAHPIFTPRRITDLAAVTDALADGLLSTVDDSEVYDLVSFCHQLPLLVIASLLGVPRADVDMVRGWSTLLAAATHRTPPNAAAIRDGLVAVGEFRFYVAELVGRQRQRDDVSPFVAAILTAEREQRASADEVVAMFVNFLFAGHETTSNLLSIGLAELLRDRQQWELLAADPSLAEQAVEELLRFVSPAQFGPMNATTDFVLGGIQVRARDTVVPMTGAANRDPAVFESPDRLDITRVNARHHLAFGVGPRYCIGQALARMEARIALEALARRWPDMQLATDALDFHGVSMLRRLARLPVILRP